MVINTKSSSYVVNVIHAYTFTLCFSIVILTTVQKMGYVLKMLPLEF